MSDDAVEIGKLANAMQPVVDYVNEIRAGKQQEQADADVNELMDFFSEADELKKIPKKLQRGFLEAHAQDTPDFVTAFDNRAKNPKAWETARKSARDALTQIASSLPGSKRQDHGISPEKLMKMPEYEWREYMEKQEALAESAVTR